ncbi:hypothetical protein L1987_33252 [Smallanthus sonchifolius]|uniref:Uncharacterized protein n=1 Tax=Smallanthus sonchifolius TaxID=185202 RepID=A0ACB9HRP9_9ASTR|nr:hypothetical protein L1987_33252 [Smallanthus sonchifolius]
MGQTPFSLVFGTEAMIPTEMVIPTARTNFQSSETNNEALAQDLDTVDELRDLAKVRIAAYQQRIAKSYNKNIRLAPKWEGPYWLATMEGDILPRSWNAIHLKTYFIPKLLLIGFSSASNIDAADRQIISSFDFTTDTLAATLTHLSAEGMLLVQMTKDNAPILICSAMISEKTFVLLLSFRCRSLFTAFVLLSFVFLLFTNSSKWHQTMVLRILEVSTDHQDWCLEKAMICGKTRWKVSSAIMSMECGNP